MTLLNISVAFYSVTDLLEEYCFHLPFWIPSHLLPGFCCYMTTWRENKYQWLCSICKCFWPPSWMNSRPCCIKVCDCSKYLHLLHGKQWLLQSKCCQLSSWHAQPAVVSCSTWIYAESTCSFTREMENLLFHLDHHMNGGEDCQENKSREVVLKGKKISAAKNLDSRLPPLLLNLYHFPYLFRQCPACWADLRVFPLPWRRTDEEQNCIVNSRGVGVMKYIPLRQVNGYIINGLM